MQERKLIACDVDGTLLANPGDSLDPIYFDLISELAELGFVFAPASGRDYSGISKLFQPVHDKLYYISTNGAQISHQDEIIYEEVLPQELFEALLSDLEQSGKYKYYINGSRDIFISEPDEDFLQVVEDYSESVITVEHWSELYELDTSLLKVVLYAPGESRAAWEEFAPKWDDKLHMVVSGSDWVDFSLADKGTGLSHLAELLEIDLEQTWAFGDQYNDLPMLDLVKHPYIMSDAYPELLERGYNTADSVVEELEKLIAAYR